MSIKPLSCSQLYRASTLSELSENCKSTKHLQPLDQIIGQDRAQQAVEFAMSIKEKGYNIYALGNNGLGKRTMVLRYLNRHEPNGHHSNLNCSLNNSAVFDWCYVVNFDNARHPKVLKLPAGQGQQFKKDVENLIHRLVKALPMAFDNEIYFARSDKLKNQLEEKQEAVLQNLTKLAQQHSISLTLTAQGDYQLTAVDAKGEAYTEEGFDQLSDKERKHFETNISELESKLRDIIRQLTVWEEEFSDKLQKLDEQIALEVLVHCTTTLKDKYNQQPEIKAHLSAMNKDILTNLEIFIESSDDDISLAYAALDKKMPRRYQVNVLVSQKTDGFPIVVEESPNYHTIFGYIENATFKGTVFTDASLIRSGSLHKANGGVLMMDAVKVLERPYVWDGLKRALRANKLNLSSLEREVSLSGTISLDPEPIPLSVKIILFGDYQTYRLLQQYDPEFKELFRVTADFEDVMPRTPIAEAHYAQFISSIIHDNNMLHCDRKAMSRIIEYSSRQAEDQDKLSLHSLDIANLLRETNYCARLANATLIRKHHVEQALANKQQRASRLQDYLLQSFVNGSTLIDISGKKVGQINALSVIATSEHQFGIPGRITATASFGEGEIFDIERQVKLGGNIHSKGVMILSAYLASAFGKTAKIPLTTRLTFEQSYGEVDGDSASLAECCAIISAFSQLPLRQDIAITGSMDQFGHAQPIGGVNEKIEGFFDVCVSKGALATQGVIIPQANVHNLMLRNDVVEAVENETFHIWAIDHVKEAVNLFTNMIAGEAYDNEEYPEHSVFGITQLRLNKLRDVKSNT
ncbi:AAA family ATPase [Moritella sp. 24]|uniref:Lon protease family protein n=1 Tax=Moritella sp. 24 TaxID=2746230 RepID=UPI001BA652CF|nr:ATP-binding protein [Moritella sp. 24]QUM77310.1 AAA family ATPase [Moritella sp. 24]